MHYFIPSSFVVMPHGSCVEIPHLVNVYFRHSNLEKVVYFRLSVQPNKAERMASRRFSIIGDANVRRNMTGLNVASRDNMKAADIIDYVGASPFEQALQLVKPDSDACIIAALTDPLLSNGDCGTVTASIDPILNSFSASIYSFCVLHPTIQVPFYFHFYHSTFVSLVSIFVDFTSCLIFVDVLNLI